MLVGSYLAKREAWLSAPLCELCQQHAQLTELILEGKKMNLLCLTNGSIGNSSAAMLKTQTETEIFHILKIDFFFLN